MALMRLTGFDPSLRHWGVAQATYDTVTKQLLVTGLDVIEPVLPTGKQVRQNSKDITAAIQLTQGAMAAVEDSHAIFVEVPVGSQSARAMAGYAICVGVLGGLYAHGKPFYQITPNEVKMVVGKRTASKQDMIAWATTRHPEAPWPTYKKNGQVSISEAKAEHQADAVAAIHAGVMSPAFQQLLLMQVA